MEPAVDGETSLASGENLRHLKCCVTKNSTLNAWGVVTLIRAKMCFTMKIKEATPLIKTCTSPDLKCQ